MDKPNCPGYIVLARYGDSYMGIIERSWSMDLSFDRALFFWSSDHATSNFGGNFKIDGLVDATHHCKEFSKKHSDLDFKIYDVHSEDLPVELDWDEWREACKPANTFSGVKDKFKARNVKFKLKEK